MSFGTGHHETTYLMIDHLLDLELREKTVLDMGSGTGILAILAEKLGAQAVTAIDVDHWSFVNAQENADRNNCKAITVLEGDADVLGDKSFDLILANINRNVLLADLDTYKSVLKDKGTLILSGFYEEDLPMIEAACRRNLLKLSKKLNRNGWVAIKFIN